jgi:hypothetical protein
VSSPPFSYRVTVGWIRDLASEPIPNEEWPSIRWDDRLFADQMRFLEVQSELGIEYNLVWGLFVGRSWPAPLKNVVDDSRAARLHAFVEAAHARGVKVLAGTGIYSWGFDEIIAKAPGVSAGPRRVMCGSSPAAWDWQRQVLDFVMDPAWGLDGLSMQSADEGRCECERCRPLSPAEYHAALLIKCAEYVRAGRPDWVVGQAGWGMRLENAEDLPHLRRISKAVDYMVEVEERSARVPGRDRASLVRAIACAFGSVGGVFVEPPMHWDRLRWFAPCGLSSARALKRLYEDGGRACEYFYRPFANPVEELSWRTGARILSSPQVSAEAALAEALASVYGVSGNQLEALSDWFARAEEAYFSRSSFRLGDGPLSLEPLVWPENPAAPGPPVYLLNRMAPAARADYARDLERLRAELEAMKIPDDRSKRNTLLCIAGTLRDIGKPA